MQGLMLRLGGMLHRRRRLGPPRRGLVPLAAVAVAGPPVRPAHRRRRLVLAGWALVLVAALPFAAQQSDRLTGAGFAVPGSQAEAVQRALARDFDAAQRAKLGVVLISHDGAGAADRRAALQRLR